METKPEKGILNILITKIDKPILINLEINPKLKN